ncbi:hypothetical protein [Roseisolibacter sp. H3M3-2]|uniref:hypothetical protein n=1 Tax=Roseisolibacter sp. H3M3-2 TaxID=3031323 RepID=UPI0023D9B6D2|nr:hypothetical protein [Roseisolibacter sp. H3M3-2]MDF1505662.1 hypothetical protein [Roseisolibacter sp. H3M3-2]
MRESVITPAAEAFADLERLVRALGEELSFFRRRALEAERRLKELQSVTGAAGGSQDGLEVLAGRLAAAESENAALKARLAEAAERTRGMADRMRFLRQQQEVDGER